MKIIDFIQMCEENANPDDELNLLFEEFNLPMPISDADVQFEKHNVNLIVRD